MHKIDKALLAAFSVSLLLGTGSVLAADAPAAATAAPAAAPAPAPTAKASAAKAEVVRAQFTSGVDKHEPTDTLTTLDNSHTRIYFYAVLVNMSGQSVTFRWTYNGVTQAEVKQTPNSARYRQARHLDGGRGGRRRQRADHQDLRVHQGRGSRYHAGAGGEHQEVISSEILKIWPGPRMRPRSFYPIQTVFTFTNSWMPCRDSSRP